MESIKSFDMEKNLSVGATFYRTNEFLVRKYEDDESASELSILFSYVYTTSNGPVLSLMMSEEGKFYMKYGKFSYLTNRDEIDFYAVLSIGESLKMQNDNLSKMSIRISKIESSLVESKRIISVLDYMLCDTDSELMKFSDLSIGFSNKCNDFVYYSDSLNDFIRLPKYWQKLDLIVRNRLDIPKEFYGRVGVLSEEKTYFCKNENYSEFELEEDKIGDEYIVRRSVYSDKIVSNGILINTLCGWKAIDY